MITYPLNELARDLPPPVELAPLGKLHVMADRDHCSAFQRYMGSDGKYYECHTSYGRNFPVQVHWREDTFGDYCGNGLAKRAEQKRKAAEESAAKMIEGATQEPCAA